MATTEARSTSRSGNRTSNGNGRASSRAIGTLTRPGVNGQTTGERGDEAEGLAKFLGLFSLGLGLVQVLAPDKLAKFIGLRNDMETINIMRGVGLREIAAGMGLLGNKLPRSWVKARVAGDAMDLALLGNAFRSDKTDHERVALATVAVLGVTFLDLLATERMHKARTPTQEGWADNRLNVRQSITVNRPVEMVYQYWHDFQNLPRFMQHLESVQMLGNGRSHWKATAPAGLSVEWDAQVVEDVPNQLIAWQSVEGSQVPNWGSVRFAPAPGDRGTEIRVQFQYEAPGGAIGKAVARMFGEEPNIQVADDLRAFKQVIETGEIVKSDATEQGKRLEQHPGRPRAMEQRAQR